MTAACSNLSWRSTPGCAPDEDAPAGPDGAWRSCTRTRAFAFPRCRRYLHRRGIKVRIARRGIEDKNHLGWHRWVVERTIFWVLRFKRLGICYDRTEATRLPLLLLAVTLINLRRLNPATEL